MALTTTDLLNIGAAWTIGLDVAFVAEELNLSPDDVQAEYLSLEQSYNEMCEPYLEADIHDY